MHPLPLTLPRRHLAVALLWWGAACSAAVSVMFAQGAAAQGTATVRELPAFTGLDLRTGAQVEVRHGERDRVEVEAAPEVAALIETKVTDGTLSVRDTASLGLRSARVRVVIGTLSAIAVGGSTRLTLGRFDLPALALAAGGSSAVEAPELFVGRLGVQAGGSSRLRMAGKVDDLALSLGGSSAADASELRASSVSMSSAGSSSARLWVDDRLSASLSGSSTVRFRGQPSVAQTTSGSARLIGDHGSRQ